MNDSINGNDEIFEILYLPSIYEIVIQMYKINIVILDDPVWEGSDEERPPPDFPDSGLYL